MELKTMFNRFDLTALVKSETVVYMFDVMIESDIMCIVSDVKQWHT